MSIKSKEITEKVVLVKIDKGILREKGNYYEAIENGGEQRQEELEKLSIFLEFAKEPLRQFISKQNGIMKNIRV